MDLFSEQRRAAFNRVQPLPVRMRPRNLDEFLGQEHFLGPGKLLRRLLAADRLSSTIFYGPPGTGKTSLAHIIAGHTKSVFVELNAAGVGVKEVRQTMEDAKHRLAANRQRTVLFLDEIHRFNRAQQDILLNDVENGLIILIGATTENHQALHDRERGLGQYNIQITGEALDHLANTSDGDARRALIALEVAVLSQPDAKAGQSDQPITIDLATAEDSIQRKAIVYDGTGDEHYDAASAFIKSMRGSDPDAAIYWLARMLEAGEDPRFIARRVVICAAEDVGNADPMALVVAQAAADGTNLVGMPECQLLLSQAVTYIAGAPKSNASTMAISQAGKDVREGRTLPVPKHLRDSHYRGATRLGHGQDYKYAHNSETGFVEQDYLGVDKTYYRPTDRGHEATIRSYLAKIRQITEKKNEDRESPDHPAAGD